MLSSTFRGQCARFIFTILIAVPMAAQAAVTWTTLADYSGTSSPSSTARSLRGLALSNDDLKLYVGFIQGTSSSAVRKVDALSGATDVTSTIAGSREPKAIA